MPLLVCCGRLLKGSSAVGRPA